MKEYPAPLISEKRQVRRQTRKIASEKLRFREGAFLGDIDIENASPQTCRKLRRIVEKRVCQHYWSGHKRRYPDNEARYTTSRNTHKHLKNLYGAEFFDYAYPASYPLVEEAGYEDFFFDCMEELGSVEMESWQSASSEFSSYVCKRRIA